MLFFEYLFEGDEICLGLLLIWKSLLWVLVNWGECDGWNLRRCTSSSFNEKLRGCLGKRFLFGLDIVLNKGEALGLLLRPTSNSLFLRSVDLTVLFRICDNPYYGRTSLDIFKLVLLYMLEQITKIFLSLRSRLMNSRLFILIKEWFRRTKCLSWYVKIEFKRILYWTVFYNSFLAIII